MWFLCVDNHAADNQEIKALARGLCQWLWLVTCCHHLSGFILPMDVVLITYPLSPDASVPSWSFGKARHQGFRFVSIQKSHGRVFRKCWVLTALVLVFWVVKRVNFLPHSLWFYLCFAQPLKAVFNCEELLMIAYLNSFLLFQVWTANSVFAKRISKPVHRGQTNFKFFLSAGTFSSATFYFAGISLGNSCIAYVDNVLLQKHELVKI